jgi:hypothetical protein
MKKIKTHILCSLIFLENHAVCKIMWENMVKSGRPQTTLWHMYTARWITEARDTIKIYNTYCSSMAATIGQTHLTVMLYVHCLSCFCL